MDQAWWMDIYQLVLNDIDSFYMGSLLVTLVTLVLTWVYIDLSRAALQSYGLIPTEPARDRGRRSSAADYHTDNSCQEEENGSSEDGNASLQLQENLVLQEHIPAQLKTARLQDLKSRVEAEMTLDQKLHEKEIEAQQLTEIYRLMQGQEDKFGMKSMQDMQEQLKLYRT